jgi:hypothetical protein
VRDLAALLAIALTVVTEPASLVEARSPRARQLEVSTASGFRLLVADENADPELRVILPGRPSSDTAIRVLFPEHVTAVKHGDGAAEHVYVFQAGRRGQRPEWHASGRTLAYERDLGRGVHLHARATLDDDGVRVRYEFTNHTSDAFDMITAVTDPRLTSIFLDQRLERTFVHHADGFDLLASETPDRLTRPLGEWLPVRYLASYRWPVPDRRVERRDDGITYIYKSRPVDEPFIATRSTDGAWVVASVARDPGNVWSNPELTCQHVDPQVALGARQQVAMEVKILVLRSSLENALKVAREQRASLR